jgi:hypothetical protein
MSKQKKRRDKPFRQKLVVMPLGLHDRQKMEFPGYAASLALGQPFLEEQHIYDLLSNADMTRRLAPDGHPLLPVAQAMVEAVRDIQVRAQELGKYVVKGDELRILREGVGKTMDFLRTVPAVQIARVAQQAVDEFNRTGALRV